MILAINIDDIDNIQDWPIIFLGFRVQEGKEHALVSTPFGLKLFVARVVHELGFKEGQRFGFREYARQLLLQNEENPWYIGFSSNFGP